MTKFQPFTTFQPFWVKWHVLWKRMKKICAVEKTSAVMHRNYLQWYKKMKDSFFCNFYPNGWHFVKNLSKSQSFPKSKWFWLVMGIINCFSTTSFYQKQSFIPTSKPIILLTKNDTAKGYEETKILNNSDVNIRSTSFWYFFCKNCSNFAKGLHHTFKPNKFFVPLVFVTCLW